MRIAIAVFDGVEELDVVGPWEVFRYAAQRVPADRPIDVSLVTLEPTDEIVAAMGMRFRPDGLLTPPVDILLIPGGGYVRKTGKGIRYQIEDGRLARIAAELMATGTLLAGVCTGAMLLGRAGLLDKRAAVTHRRALDDLRTTACEVVEARVVDDGNIITCGGVTSGFDLALWIVERFYKKELADDIAEFLAYRRSTNIFVSERAKAALTK